MEETFKIQEPQITPQYTAEKSEPPFEVTNVTNIANSKVEIVIPALNEEKNIEEIIRRVKDLGYDNVLVIDGKSKDGTLKVAAKNGAKVVIQKGKGKGNAIRQVFKNDCIDFDVVVLMDADGSMSPDELPALIKALATGADVVKGSRFLKGGYTHDMTVLRRLGNTMMISAVNLLWSAKFTDLCYGFVAFNKRAIEKLAPVLTSENFEIETEIFIKALRLGLDVKEIPSTEYKRQNGESNLNTFRDGFKIFKTIATEFLYS